MSLEWTEAVVRLLLTVIVGALLGYNRSEHGKAAGIRTTLLVCLAASVAMIARRIATVIRRANRSPTAGGGTPYTWANLTGSPARLLGIFSPGGIEGCFRELVAIGNKNAEPVAAAYGCSIVGSAL